MNHQISQPKLVKNLHIKKKKKQLQNNINITTSEKSSNIKSYLDKTSKTYQGNLSLIPI